MKEIIKMSAAVGGEGWQERATHHQQELGTLWGQCGCDSEFGTLKKVLLHRPQSDYLLTENPQQIFWDDTIDIEKAQDQHDAMTEIYKKFGVDVVELDCTDMATVKPNQFFVRDLFVMTPEGAILSRPASVVRAGEEVPVYQTLAKHHIPLIKILIGDATFEGTNLVFIDKSLALIGLGHRSNPSGIAQVKQVLSEMGIESIEIQLPYGSRHLDGTLNILDKRKVIVFPRRTSYCAVAAFRHLGYDILELPLSDEGDLKRALNFVCLAPGVILMPKGAPQTAKLYREHGIEVIETDVSELIKAGGAIHCMTGIIWRETGW